LLRDQKSPHVTKRMHSRVVDLRLEGSFVITGDVLTDLHPCLCYVRSTVLWVARVDELTCESVDVRINRQAPMRHLWQQPVVIKVMLQAMLLAS